MDRNAYKDNKWKIEDLYKSEEDFNKELKKLETKVQEYSNYKGKILESSDTLLAFLKFDTEFSKRLEQLFIYAHINNDSDTRDSHYQELYGKVINLNALYNELTSYVVPELLVSDYSLISKYLEENKELKEYERNLKKIYREKEHILSKEEENIISNYSKLFNMPEEIESVLTDSDFTFDDIVVNGQKVTLTESNYNNYIRHSEQSVRKSAFLSLYKTYKKYNNTLAAILKSEIELHNINAKVRKYSSALEASLYGNEIDSKVYYNLIESVHKNLQPLYDYFTFKKNYLKLDNIHYVTNGTISLQLAINALNIESGEIITTPFTYIATLSSILWQRCTPVFVDINEKDFNIDVTKIEKKITTNTKAIMAVHCFGIPCNVAEIDNIAKKNNLKVIYDAAHSFGTMLNNKSVLSYGDISCCSFHATKVFNTIEGGAVTFSDHNLYEKLYNLKNFGIRGEELVTDVGANAKMNEFCAIMGLCNLKHADMGIAARKERFDYYCEKLYDIRGIQYFQSSAWGTKNYAYFPIIVTDEYTYSRDELYAYLHEKNIYSRKYFYPLTSDQECFKNKYKDNNLDIARNLASRILVLPLYEDLEKEKIDYIITQLKDKQ